ncbi:MAG: PAS domain-containing protein, partial [Flavobacteriaceae bacterium]|nr:PAS domain-containing protein [Flavobacteriaceae bacterium]
MGKATDVDRCYVFENKVNDEGKLLLYYVYEWCNVGITPYLGNPELSGLEYSLFPGLFEILSEDKPLYGIVKNSKDKTFREIMDMQGIISYLFLPILLDGKFWGWIGFDDCLSERKWNEGEVVALHTVAKNIGLRLSQHFSFNKLKLALNEIDIYLDNSDQVSWTWHLKTNKMEYSFNWFRLFGYDSKELPEYFKQWELNIHPDDLLPFRKKLKTQLKNKKFEGILRYRHKQNKYLWVKYQAHQIFDPHNQEVKVIGSFVDITSLKNKELEVKRQKKEYENLSNSISEVIFKISHTGNIIFLNTKWKKFTGLTSAESLEENFMNFFLETNDVNNQFKSLSNFLTKKPSKNTSRQYKLILKIFNDKNIWVIVDINFYKKPNLFTGTITNVSENELLRQKLNESNKKYSFIANNTSDTIIVHDIEGIIDFVSKSSEQMLGYKPDELKNKNPYDYIHPNDILKVKASHEKIINHKSKQVCDYRFKHKAGHWVWLETSTNPIVEEGKLMGMISSSRDISKLKIINQKIVEALEKEKELNKLKSNFVSMASHQFRTPLTVLYSNIELLDLIIQDNGDFDINTKDKALIRMKNEVSRMTELINNFLIYGKYDSGHIKKKIKELNLCSLIEDLVDKSFNVKNTGRFVQIQTKGNEKSLYSDESLLEHIFSNLISNAIKYSDKTKDPEIIIDYRLNYVDIHVIDYGIGIPKQNINNLFNSFYRAENTDNIKGTGLGLVIVKEFLGLLKGQIKLTSKEGIGTNIEIKIP